MHARWRIYFILLIFSGVSFFTVAQENKNDFLSRINSISEFNRMAGKPLSAKYGNVSSIKVVYHIKSQTLYYINSRRYKYHFEFCSRFLNMYSELEQFNSIEYSSNRDRVFLLANLNYFPEQNLYVLEFFADDKISAWQVISLYQKIKASTYFSDRLVVVMNSLNLINHKSLICSKTSCIDVDSLYGSQRYQCLVKGKATGKLVFVTSDKLSEAGLSAENIVVTNGLPLLVPPVAGIVTNELQTPLSHVNVLAQSRKLPDAAKRGIWKDSSWRKYENTWVTIHVDDDSVWIEPAKQIATGIKKHRKISLSGNMEEAPLQSVSKLRIRHIDTYGGKACNLGEMFRIKGDELNLPEGSFAIPFYFYHRHITRSGAYKSIDSLLTDSVMLNDFQKRSAILKRIRDLIRNYPVEKSLLDSVSNRLAKFPQYKYFRFRSSTNAEDTDGFNGAGLYDSYSGSLGDTLKTIARAIQKVWSSVWNERAFTEREIFYIEQHSVAMGILVHRAFGDERANGVAITANIYRYAYPSFVINCQHGEVSVVSPDSGVQCEQLILNHKVYSAAVQDVSVDYITHSSIENGKPVLSEDELFALARQLFKIKEHFYYRTRYGRRAKGFLSFAMDVEFKVDKDTGKIYIKQARPYAMIEE